MVSPALQAVFLFRARAAGFDLNCMAREMGASEKTVSRAIRRLFDRTAAEWLKEQRLLASLEYLAQTGSVKRAAFEAGFKQQAHYSREFKKTFAITPSAYLARRQSAVLSWADTNCPK